MSVSNFFSSQRSGYHMVRHFQIIKCQAQATQSMAKCPGFCPSFYPGQFALQAQSLQLWIQLANSGSLEVLDRDISCHAILVTEDATNKSVGTPIVLRPFQGPLCSRGPTLIWPLEQDFKKAYAM